MLQKNIEKNERKAKRKPPIPPTRRTPTLCEKIKKNEKKYKKRVDIFA